jgi:predicted alpha/beta-hydrolase family hydrolase
LSVRRSSGSGSTPIVYVTEGEKDADRLAALGYTATCCLGGANKWREEYTSELRGCDCVIIADNDEVGIKSARSIEAALQGVASSIQVVVAREGKDVSDHLDAGLTVGELRNVDIDVDVLAPIDWETYKAAETEWLYEPYIPRRGRTLAFGPPGSLKSLWAMWVAAKLTHQGHKVAYFSLEMRPSESARRLKQAGPRKDNLSLYTKFNFNNAEQLVTICKALKGTDLIVVDSWSSAHDDTNSNDAVARLDNEVFQPIITATGAALLILDNVGHPSMGKDGTRSQPDWARGASAKGDKMEVTLFFQRPDDNDNYRTQMTVKKMRLDHAIPPTDDIWTEPDKIEFYEMAGKIRSWTPVWDLGGETTADAAGDAPEQLALPGLDEAPQAPPENVVEMSLSEQLALARVMDKLGATPLDEGNASG